MAKTTVGRVNYPIDLVADEGLENPVLDSFLHLFNEVVFAKGPLDKKLHVWIKKTMKHRSKRS